MRWLIGLLFCVILVPGVFADTITGTVSSSGGPILNADVEAWLGETLIVNTTTDSLGTYTLDSLITGQSYLVRAYQFYNLSAQSTNPMLCWNTHFGGFIPGNQVVTPQSGVDFLLNPIPEEGVDYFSDYDERTTFRGTQSVSNAGVLRRGDVIFSYPPDSLLNGVGVNCWDNERGMFFMDAWGDDPGTGLDEGAVNGELITFRINDVPATLIAGSNLFDLGTHIIQISTTGSLEPCQILPSSWNQTTASVSEDVTITLQTVGCSYENFSVSVFEGGVDAKGAAVTSPGIIEIPPFGSATATWTAEFIDDASGGDNNPPEYYFVATNVLQPAVTTDSSAYGELLSVGADATPPVISNVQVQPFGNVVIVTWDTDEASSSQVEWGPTIAYGSQISNASLLTTHWAVLTGITLDASYEYQITVSDIYGNNATYQNSFTRPSLDSIDLVEGAYNYYAGVDDTTIREDREFDYGGSLTLYIGDRDIGNGNISQGLIKFPLDVIPSGSNISSATLSLYYYYGSPFNQPAPIDIELYEVLSAWQSDGGEESVPITVPGMATWQYRIYNTQIWNVPGAGGTDRGILLDSVHLDNQSALGYYTFTLDPSIVQNWLNTPSSNNGMVIIPTGYTQSTSIFMRSSNYGSITQRPMLTVAYSSSGCTLPLDEPTCNCVDLGELANSISAWYNDQIGISGLMSYIRTWKTCSAD